MLLVDVARADAPSVEIASTSLVTAGNQVPLNFRIAYDPDRVSPRAQTYRLQARPGERKLYILREQAPDVQDIAWKAQSRLTARYRKLIQRGKRSTVVTTAIAREMAAFMWDIARRTTPTH
mgnify:CR=1 FL=1